MDKNAWATPTLVKFKGMEEQDIYAIIGDDGFERLVAAFYRQVPGDDVLGPLYPAPTISAEPNVACATFCYFDSVDPPPIWRRAAIRASVCATPPSPSEPPHAIAGFN